MMRIDIREGNLGVTLGDMRATETKILRARDRSNFTFFWNYSVREVMGM